MDPAPTEPRATPWYHWRRLGWNFLTVSVLAHVVFVLVAASLIVATIQGKQKTPPPPGQKDMSALTRAAEHKVQMAQKQKSMSAPAALKRVTTTAPAQVALPAMPAMPSLSSAALPTTMSGMNGGGFGPGGFGNSGGRGGTGVPLNFFGLSSGQGLVGTFYDLKQNKDRAPTHFTTQQFADEVSRFVAGSWNTAMLAKYFSGPKPVYAQQIFIPSIPASEGPAAFGLEKEVQPSLWVVYYQAKVTPTVSGTYHFVGGGDDILMVRFDNKLVLSRNWDNPSLGVVKTPWKPQANYDYHYPPGNLNIPNGFAKGNSIEVTAGTSYTMEVLIGEESPPYCFMALMISKDGDEYEKDAGGNPRFPVFRLTTAPLPPAKAGTVYAPHADKDGPPWRVVSSGPASPFR